jgi:hypothetical protein
MDYQLEPVLDWLKSCKEQQVRIEKTEIGDVDVTFLHLRDVSLSSQDASRDDDYIAPDEIVLHGEGTIWNGKGNPPLPGNRFEIALSGDWTGDFRGAELSLTTGRAHYVISKDEGEGGETY